MKKIDADDHVGNRFSDGEAGVSDATTLDASYSNAIMDEVVNVIEGAGLTLDQAQNTLGGQPNNAQMLEAIKVLIGLGGNPLAPNLLNDQSVAQSLAGLSWDKTKTHSVFLYFDIMRKTATQRKKQQGLMQVYYDDFSDTWDFEIVNYSWDDETGVEFSLDVDGNTAQLQYTTDDLSGGSYFGKFRVTNIITNKI